MPEEALAYAGAMLSDEPTGFRGDDHALEPFPITRAPSGNVRLLVVGVGASKTPRLAGTYADEPSVYPGADLSDRIDRVHEAARRAGDWRRYRGGTRAPTRYPRLGGLHDEGRTRHTLRGMQNASSNLGTTPAPVRRDGGPRHHPVPPPGRTRPGYEPRTPRRCLRFEPVALGL